MDEHEPSRSWTAGWASLAALVLGLAMAGVCTGVLGSQLWQVKQQLERQHRIRTLVAEAGLSRDLVPKIESNNRWAIGSSTGFVLGIFWFVWGLVRYKNECRRAAITSTSRDAPGANDPISSAVLHSVNRAPGLRPARRRSKHRQRR